MANTIRHFAINAEDLGRAQDFYSQVFGWKFQAWGPPGFFQIDDGGGEDSLMGALQQRRTLQEGHKMTGVECTVSVEDIDAVAEAVQLSGGKLLMEKTTIHGVGTMLFFEDPEGNVMGAMQYMAR